MNIKDVIRAELGPISVRDLKKLASVLQDDANRKLAEVDTLDVFYPVRAPTPWSSNDGSDRRIISRSGF